MIRRSIVKSTNLLSAGYDESEKIMEVEFAGGKVYQYYEVPKHLYEGFLKAESKGKFFIANVRNGGFKYNKMPEVVNEEKEQKSEKATEEKPSDS